MRLAHLKSQNPREEKELHSVPGFGVKIALPACEQTSAGRAGCCNTGWPPTGREGVCGLSVARCLPSFVAERKNEWECSAAASLGQNIDPRGGVLV